MGQRKDNLPARSSQAEVDAFLSKVASISPPAKRGKSPGRLLFAMDATASREPTWDTACNIQARMFEETSNLGGLDVQLCYYRGFNDFHATSWVSDPKALLSTMTAVSCAAGTTQIEKALRHAVREAKRSTINAMVFVGDCMEEDIDKLCKIGGELGLLGVPLFIFHEGFDPAAETTFKQLAKLTGGAYCRFDAASAAQLRDLLSAVAVYAAGGRNALENFGNRRGGVALQLTHQIKRP